MSLSSPTPQELLYQFHWHEEIDLYWTGATRPSDVACSQNVYYGEFCEGVA
eukprot:SAG11_NODE_30465_length_300_cov_2.671642_1_plen_50_part_01